MSKYYRLLYSGNGGARLGLTTSHFLRNTSTLVCDGVEVFNSVEALVERLQNPLCDKLGFPVAPIAVLLHGRSGVAVARRVADFVPE